MIIDILSAADAAFPWSKLERLVRRPEIWQGQLQDGDPPIDALNIRELALRPDRNTWLVMEEARTVGYVTMTQQAEDWCDIHTGFRPHISVAVKRDIFHFLAHFVRRAGIRFIFAFIPRHNKPARNLAVACGFRRIGVLPAAFFFRGTCEDYLTYGVKIDELPHRFTTERVNVHPNASQHARSIAADLPERAAKCPSRH